MSTLQQSAIGKKVHKPRRIHSPSLKKCPQRRGICLRVTYMKPKKPNSAIRKIVKVFSSSKKSVLAYISGCGHKLQQHSIVLVRGGRVRDLPGMHYKLVKGKHDFFWYESITRNQSRSKYGIPSSKRILMLAKIYSRLNRKK